MCFVMRQKLQISQFSKSMSSNSNYYMLKQKSKLAIWWNENLRAALKFCEQKSKNIIRACQNWKFGDVNLNSKNASACLNLLDKIEKYVRLIIQQKKSTEKLCFINSRQILIESKLWNLKFWTIWIHVTMLSAWIKIIDTSPRNLSHKFSN